MSPPLYAARCSPAPAHTRLTPAAPSTPCAMNIHYRQAAARSGYDYGVVHIKYVVTCTALCGLVTLTFDLLTLKVVSESDVTWATSMPILVFLRLSVLELGPMYATDVRRQIYVRRIAVHCVSFFIAKCLRPLGAGHNNDFSEIHLSHTRLSV